MTKKRYRRNKDTPPIDPGDPYAVAASEGGGALFTVRLFIPAGKNGGCGAPTHVVGTNEGTMPCGNTLKQLDGKSELYYCGSCNP